MVAKAPMTKLSRHLLYEEVAERIRGLIREQRLWGSYLPPERELARIFGVNRDTIRKGLSLLEEEKAVTRRQGQGTRVLPRSGARRPHEGPHVVVATFLGDPLVGYFGEMLSGVSAGAGDADWSVSYSNLAKPGGHEAFLDDLRRRDIDGLMIASVADRAFVEQVLGAWSGPTVLVDHEFSGLPLTCVRDDSWDGARQAADHLLGLGHRRIAYVDITKREYNPWRHDGYVQALRAAGVEPEDGLVVPCRSGADACRLATEELLARPEPPTAIFAFDDARAWGVWQAVEARGLEVGKDIAIVGFGDNGSPSRPADQLSSVRFSARGVGLVAARELNEAMTGRSELGRQVLVPTELVARKSSAEARPAKA